MCVCICICFSMYVCMCIQIYIKLSKNHLFITVRKRSCGKVMFLHVYGILFTGGRCTPPWADTPLGRHPQADIPLGRHPPWQTPPLGRHPLRQTPPLGRHPPGRHPSDGHCSGRYASYWNAFLLYILCLLKQLHICR